MAGGGRSGSGCGGGDAGPDTRLEDGADHVDCLLAREAAKQTTAGTVRDGLDDAAVVRDDPDATPGAIVREDLAAAAATSDIVRDELDAAAAATAGASFGGKSRKENRFGADARGANGDANRSAIKYRKDEMLMLRFSDDRSDEKWVEVYEAMGATALELDSIFTHNEQEHFGWGNAKQGGKKDDEHESCEHGEEVEYYSDSSDCEGLRKPALYVEGEPDFDSGPPQDGFEFLRRVRWEEARCERVKVAKVAASKLLSEQTPYMPQIPPILQSDAELLPSESWETEFLADFSDLRANLLWQMGSVDACTEKELPHIKDRDAWRVYCFGSESRSPDNETSSDYEQQQQQEQATEEQQVEQQTGQLPYLSTLITMDEVSRATLLRHHIAWLEDLENLPEERAMWIYALAAAVDEPLDVDTTAAVRDLLRKCALVRATRKFCSERELQMLNIVITIAGRYFGQADG